MTYRALISAGLLLAVAVRTHGVRADDLFTLNARSTADPTISVTATGENLVDLVGNLIETEEEFISLANQNVAGSLDYAGVEDAILFTRNAAGTRATLRIPSTGLDRTFSADEEEELEEQIEDFIKADGAEEWARFLREINERSLVGISDGNPLATTARLSDAAFYRFGLLPNPFRAAEDGALTTSEWRAELGGGRIEADTINGHFAILRLSTAFRLSDNVAFAFVSPLGWRSYEGSDVFDGGTVLALPIGLLIPEGESGWGWTLTPTVAAGIGASFDMSAGSMLWGGGITSSLSYYSGPLTVTLANQFSAYEGRPLDIGEYEFETDVSQRILKNGLRVVYEIGDGFVDGGLTHTRFLEDAAVEDYVSPTAGVGLRLGESSGVRLSYRGDYADDFRTHAGWVHLFFGG